MKTRTTLLALLAAMLLGLVGTSVGVSYEEATVAPGTTVFTVEDVVFLVTTDRTIDVALGFVGTDVLEGQVAVQDPEPATVRIVWRDKGQTVFSGVVVSTTSIRYKIPSGGAPQRPAQQDSGHTEK